MVVLPLSHNCFSDPACMWCPAWLGWCCSLHAWFWWCHWQRQFLKLLSPINFFHVGFYIFSTKKKVCSRSLYWAISRKKTSRGLRTYFFETPLQFLIFFFYHWKFQTKQSSTPGNSTKLCQIPSLENPGRSPRPLPCWKFHIIFSWSSLEVPLRF